jgi:hypothetical protein
MKNVVMKISKVIFIVLTLLVASPVMKSQAQPGASISFSIFYNSLAPYGYWVNDPGYGYFWVPEVGPAFRPYYSGGHWVMTSYGNLWVSDYAWGWAPFHYGRWIYDAFYGWVWIPGSTWAPAWVSWRWGGGYCGWATLGPGISLSVAYSSYAPPVDWWVFIEPAYMYSPVFYRYYEGPSVNVTYLPRTSFVSNTYVQNGTTYLAGPGVSDVERVSNQRVDVYDVKDGRMPSRAGISGNSVQVYAPEIKASGGKGVTPSRYTQAEQPLGKMAPLDANSGKPGRMETQGDRKLREGGAREPGMDPAKPARRSEERINGPDYSRSKNEEFDRRQQKQHAPAKSERQDSPGKRQALPPAQRNQDATRQPDGRNPDKERMKSQEMQRRPEMQPPRESQRRQEAQPPREQRMPAAPQPPRVNPPKKENYQYPAPAPQPMDHGSKSQGQPRQPKEHGGKK